MTVTIPLWLLVALCATSTFGVVLGLVVYFYGGGSGVGSQDP